MIIATTTTTIIMMMNESSGVFGGGEGGEPGLEPEDLNTDGIDPSGRDVWIHDCYILNDDDSIAVKPSDGNSNVSACSQAMVIEDMVMTGASSCNLVQAAGVGVRACVPS